MTPLEWLAVIGTLSSSWFIGGKKRWGWIVAGVASCLWIWWALRTHAIGVALTNGIFLFIYAINWWRWRPNKYGILPDKICNLCGKNMKRVGGFTRARDFNAFMRGEQHIIPEYCDRCIIEINKTP